MREATAGREQPTVVAVYWGDRPDRAIDLIGANRDQRPVVRDEVTMDMTGDDVDSQQLVASVVPSHPFAEDTLVVRRCDSGRFVHARSRVHPADIERITHHRRAFRTAKPR